LDCFASLAMTWNPPLHLAVNIGQIHRETTHRDVKRFHNAE